MLREALDEEIKPAKRFLKGVALCTSPEKTDT